MAKKKEVRMTKEVRECWGRDTVAMRKAKIPAEHYVIVRTYSAGCHAGVLEHRNGKEVTLTNSRRLWYWNGAASLSGLAVSGTSKPDSCKFPPPVGRITLTEAIEIIDCTKEGRASIEAVPPWKG